MVLAQPTACGSVCRRVTTGQEADHADQDRLHHLGDRGTFVGDILWLAMIAFVFAIITGVVG